jgi:hypothetical protein
VTEGAADAPPLIEEQQASNLILLAGVSMGDIAEYPPDSPELASEVVIASNAKNAEIHVALF